MTDLVKVKKTALDSSCDFIQRGTQTVLTDSHPGSIHSSIQGYRVTPEPIILSLMGTEDPFLSQPKSAGTVSLLVTSISLMHPQSFDIGKALVQNFHS